MLWDAIVIGAGPAGAAVATLLARAGLGALVLEQAEFPRFQIGESLLPVCLPVLERLGLEPRRDSHLFKRGAEFVRESSSERRVIDFSTAREGFPTHAYQVDRKVFDARLRDGARRAGATVEHGARVTGVELGERRVEVMTERGRHAARYLVDASGQGRCLARQFGAAEPHRGFGSAAAYVHFDGVAKEVFDELAPNHDIRVMIVGSDWGWIIPLPGQRLSVGLVTRRRGIVQELLAWVESSPLLRRWTRGTTRSEPRAVRNFSYLNRRAHGSRFACVGDAACFLDPVFSSGVSLALLGAANLSDRLVPALGAATEAEPELMAPLGQAMKRAYATFAAMIDRFYNTQFVDHFVFGKGSDGELTRGVVGVLAGDVFGEENRFQKMLLDSRRRAGGVWA